MNVAYLFSTPNASFILEKMIVPQLEEGRHGASVAGMFFFFDNNYLLVRGNPTGERLHVVILERAACCSWAAISAATSAPIADKLFEGVPIGCFPDLYKALSSARIDQVRSPCEAFWGGGEGCAGPVQAVHRAPPAPHRVRAAQPLGRARPWRRGWQGGAPRLGPAGRRWRPRACSRLRGRLRSRSAGPGAPRRRARRRTRRSTSSVSSAAPFTSTAAAPREWRARAADRIPAEIPDRLAEQGRGLVQVGSEERRLRQEAGLIGLLGGRDGAGDRRSSPPSRDPQPAGRAAESERLRPPPR